MSTFYTEPTTGAKIATDDFNNLRYQIMKLDMGTAGVSMPVTGSLLDDSQQGAGMQAFRTGSMLHVYNATADLWTRVRSANNLTDNFGGGTALGSVIAGKNAANNFDLLREVDAASGTTGRGILAVAPVGSNAGTFQPVQLDTNNNLKANIAQIGSTAFPSNTNGFLPSLISTSGALACNPSIFATVTGYGLLRVSGESSALFYDSFDGVIDTTNKWNVITQVNGGIVGTTNGGIILSGSTALSGQAALQSQPSFAGIVPGFAQVVYASQLEATPYVTGGHRFWGVGTKPTAPTPATPLTDAVGWEIDSNGTLNAVVYNNGIRTIITNLTAKAPTDGLYHSYTLFMRTDRCFWYVDSLDVPVAVSNFNFPNNENLPLLQQVLTSLTAQAQAPTIVCNGVAVGDTGHNNGTISDGINPWRRATVKTSGTAATTADLPLVVAIHPSSPVTQGPSGSIAWSFIGNKTNNSLPPAADNLGVLPAVVVGGTPALIDGYQTSMWVDLEGRVRTADIDARRLLEQILVSLSAENNSTGNPENSVRSIPHSVIPPRVSSYQPLNTLANIHGVPYAIGGHPNLQTFRANYTTAQTDTAIISPNNNLLVVVTSLMMTLDKAASANVTARVGFGTTSTPSGAGVIAAHPGIDPGGGFVKGDGSGIIGVGSLGDPVRITSTVPTGGSIDVVISYYLIES